MRASANVSYKDAAKDIQHYTGMKVSERTQQRIVHRYKFPLEESLETIEEMSLDGGKIRFRTQKKGEGSHWKDYKAICTNGTEKKAWFGENDELITWVNQQEMSTSLTCLGDGHPGVWKLIKQINSLIHFTLINYSLESTFLAEVVLKHVILLLNLSRNKVWIYQLYSLYTRHSD